MKRSHYLDLRTVRITEPRLEMIKSQLEALLQVIELEKDGEVVEVDGFRLKNIEDWLVPIEEAPEVILSEITRPCNLRCEFCYLEGLPPGEGRPFKWTSFEEIATKIRYFCPEKGTMLFRTLTHVEESLLHPQLFEILALMREKTDLPFELITNGKVLTEPFIQRLSEFMPLNISVSLNSANPEIRRSLMRDKRPEIAVESLMLLRKYEIPFRVGIVPWPSVPLDDLMQTIRYADQNYAYIVRIGLPGYTKYYPLEPEHRFDRNEYWTRLVKCVLSLTEEVQTPLVIIPYLFVENLIHDRKNEAFITGTVRNSPAALAGLRPGDHIVEVNDIFIISRSHAKDLIRQVPKDQLVVLIIRRGETFYKVTINPETHGQLCSYPYKWHVPMRGLLIPEGFRLGYLDEVKRLIEAHRARTVLLLTTELMRPTLMQALDELPIIPTSIDLYIEVPAQNFWGGNILAGDLLVVQDYIDHINSFIATRGFRPDLVLIPDSGFHINVAGGWKRDIMGVYYKYIERETHVPVELIRTQTIFY